ncbi:MAG TPA: beta-ketoacyl-[acyl-carrier-protein] synthase family protein [Amycolatopsis sp.]|nr:beta-ketoacyl-[acyl-carrier-protein] synthase family protein [Amycolatopsis sp.]
MTRRAVITGIGVTSPGAVGREAYWDLLTAGRSATRRVTLFDPSPFRSQMAGEVDFDGLALGLSSQQVRRMDRAAQFAVVCTREAVEDSGLDLKALAPHRIGVSIGSATGCTVGLETEYTVVSDDGRKWLVDHEYGVPELYGYMLPSTLAVEVAWDVAAEGPTALISTGCTSGMDSVGHGAALIENGTADVVLAGATDAPVSRISLAAFDAIKATSPNNADPEHASKPFDARRDGFVLAEGAAVMVLEEAEAARKRGARIYAELRGFATRSNAFHMTGLKPDGREMSEAIRVALDQAKTDPTEIGYINAHGSGTKQNDRHETAAFKNSLGDHAYHVPVSSIKSMIGHSLGAIGSLELAACALALERQVVPPTANLEQPDPDLDLDYVPITAREHKLDVVLSVGSGFGGFQSAAVLARTGR